MDDADSLSGLLADWHIAEDSYTVAPYELGRGQFGVVKGAEWNGTPVAMKILFNSDKEENANLFKKELALMQTLHHPHIVQFLGWVKNSDGFGIAMEHMPRGSVEEYVEARGGDIPKAVKLTWCDHMAQALTYLHNRKPDFLIHRDVKPANFLLTPSLQCKLADFGVSRIIDKREQLRRNRSSESPSKIMTPDEELVEPERVKKSVNINQSLTPVKGNSAYFLEASHSLEQTSNCGTVRYMAPEVRGDMDRSKAVYSVQADVFSVGMVFYFVMEGKKPSVPGGRNPAAHFEALAAGKRPLFTGKTGAGMRRVIEACCSFDAPLRPTARELITLLRAQQPRTGARGGKEWSPPPQHLGSSRWAWCSCLLAPSSRGVDPEYEAAAQQIYARISLKSSSSTSAVLRAENAV